MGRGFINIYRDGTSRPDSRTLFPIVQLAGRDDGLDQANPVNPSCAPVSGHELLRLAVFILGLL